MCYLISMFLGGVVVFYSMKRFGKIDFSSMKKLKPKKEGVVSMIKEEKEDLWSRRVNLEKEKDDLEKEIKDFEKFTNMKVK